jgi:hypothetical protein
MIHRIIYSKAENILNLLIAKNKEIIGEYPPFLYTQALDMSYSAI